MDVVTAFLIGQLEEETFKEQPESYVSMRKEQLLLTKKI